MIAGVVAVVVATTAACLCAAGYARCGVWSGALSKAFLGWERCGECGRCYVTT